ncbi:MAG: hypothetical protein U9N73_03035 [Candidatus Auribacterota bacterium]|nr:hypothetical protein [Candidatus Auribacterota bacterium]
MTPRSPPTMMKKTASNRPSSGRPPVSGPSGGSPGSTTVLQEISR